jgi:hypothetical protein
VAVGVAGNGSAHFSRFFRHFRFRVKLVVKSRPPLFRPEVTSSTAVACSKCPETEFSLDAGVGGRLLAHLQSHADAAAADHVCFVCDQRVADIRRHFDEFDEIHFRRLRALATCTCVDQVPILQSRQDYVIIID